MPSQCSKLSILEKARSMGVHYALDGVLTLEELGLKSFPMTVTGKIRKDELRRIVMIQREPQSDANHAVNPQDEAAQVTHLTPVREQEMQAPPKSTAALHRKQVENENRHVEPNQSTADLDTQNDLLAIWEELVGIRPSSTDTVKSYADSITQLRFCDRFLKRFGRRVNLQDLMTYTTVETLATFLNSKSRNDPFQSSSKIESFQVRDYHVPLISKSTISPPSPPPTPTKSREFGARPPVGSSAFVKDKSDGGQFNNYVPSQSVAHTRAMKEDDPFTTEHTSAVSEALQSFGLGAQDVEDVLPIKDYFCQIARGERPQSNCHRICFRLDHSVGSSRLWDVLEICLRSHPILRTIMINPGNDKPFHVVIKPSIRLFHYMIEERIVQDNEEARLLVADDKGSAFSPLLMVQARIINVRSTNTTYLSFTYNHVVFDLMSINPFHADIDRLLCVPDLSKAMIPPLTPFRIFADLNSRNNKSCEAQASVAFNVHRLRGISKFEDSLWPPRQAPGMFLGTDRDASPAMVQERNKVRNRIWAATGMPWTETPEYRHNRIARAARVLNLPDISQICKLHGVDPQSLVKTALAIFNVRQTGQPFALFNTVEAARTWPFTPDWMEQILPSAVSIDGPTVEWVLNMPRVDLKARGNKTQAGELMVRLQKEQKDMTAHAHVPWFQVLDNLGPEEAAVAVEASHRQSFVWDISMRLVSEAVGDYGALRWEGRFDWADW
jgi:acyl carrier protein